MVDKKENPKSFWQKISGKCQNISPTLLLSIAVLLNMLGDIRREIRMRVLIDTITDLQHRWIDCLSIVREVLETIEYLFDKF